MNEQDRQQIKSAESGYAAILMGMIMSLCITVGVLKFKPQTFVILIPGAVPTKQISSSTSNDTK